MLTGDGGGTSHSREAEPWRRVGTGNLRLGQSRAWCVERLRTMQT